MSENTSKVSYFKPKMLLNGKPVNKWHIATEDLLRLCSNKPVRMYNVDIVDEEPPNDEFCHQCRMLADAEYRAAWRKKLQDRGRAQYAEQRASAARFHEQERQRKLLASQAPPPPKKIPLTGLEKIQKYAQLTHNLEVGVESLQCVIYMGGRSGNEFVCEEWEKLHKVIIEYRQFWENLEQDTK